MVKTERAQQLVKEGRLPAKLFGGSLMIEEKDLKLVADRKPGRPKKHAHKGGRKKERKRLFESKIADFTRL